MKTDRVIAKYLAIQNAAEFIRSHGDEGGIEQEDYPCDIYTYMSERDKIADILDKMAAKHAIKYKSQMNFESPARIGGNF